MSADDRHIDAAGRTVIPGLIDAHFHAYAISLHSDVIEMTPLSYVALAAARRLSSALRRGFTTVRDVAGGDAGLASAIAGGLLSSPRYLYTGAALSQTGGHGIHVLSGSTSAFTVDARARLLTAKMLCASRHASDFAVEHTRSR